MRLVILMFKLSDREGQEQQKFVICKYSHGASVAVNELHVCIHAHEACRLSIGVAAEEQTFPL